VSAVCGAWYVEGSSQAVGDAGGKAVSMVSRTLLRFSGSISDSTGTPAGTCSLGAYRCNTPNSSSSRQQVGPLGQAAAAAAAGPGPG
jgi:hypothetical protein